MPRKQRSGVLHIVLGDQLDADSLLWQHFDSSCDTVFMAEVRDESAAVPSSKQRTALFFAAMRHFVAVQEKLGRTVDYTNITAGQESLSAALALSIKKLSPVALRCVVPGDVRVLNELQTFAKAQALDIEWIEDQHFIAAPGEFAGFMEGRKQARMEYWYRHLRKTRNVLMDDAGKPLGGKWNYDKDNRKAFGKAGPGEVPEVRVFRRDKLTSAALADIQQHLPDLPGEVDSFNWAVNRKQALQLLDDFIEHGLTCFGDYQDAMWTDEPFLFHSRLSACLNLKLLHPLELIEAAEAAYHNGEAGLNAVEGFIRQILGWREYVRGLYWHHRDEWLRLNALDATRELPAFYWTADTKMRCMQHSIQQVLTLGYGHHIQRLMVTGLFSLLWGVKPAAIHSWYLAMYVDAVAWVEVPNTIGMSQYADGGIVGSKPYIASGAYIHRMSNYCGDCEYKPKQAFGDDACPFTTLYWDFVARHRDLLRKNPRLGMQVRNLDNKPAADREAIAQRAKQLFIEVKQI